MTRPIDDPPTGALPVAPASRADEDFLDEEFSEPKRRSRLTIALVAAVLVAFGFLAGVIVGRATVSYAGSGAARPATTAGTGGTAGTASNTAGNPGASTAVSTATSTPPSTAVSTAPSTAASTPTP